MAHVTIPTPVLQPPGPGTWILDTTHFFRPVTRFTQEVFPEASGRGFSEGTAPYGLLLDRLAWGFADSWPYLSPRPVWAVDGTGPAVADRARWEALVAGSEALRDRLVVSSAVFERTPWRDDLQWWETKVRPELTARHHRLAEVDVAGLDDDELLAHVATCRTALQRAIRVHHRLNVAAVLPVGDFLGRARQWTGRPYTDLLALLVGTSPVAAMAGDELATLVAALGDNGEARALLAHRRTDSGAVLAALTAAGGAVGPATAAYVGGIGYWPLGGGFDVGEPAMSEAPDVLVEGIAAALADAECGGAGHEALDERTAEVTATVPAADRPAFDRALVEARATYRLRDERAVFSDIWANGLTRRALLELGRRLVDTGAVEEPAHLVEGEWHEVQALAGDHTGGGAPAAGELAARARRRAEATPGDAPPMLGDPPRPPVPVDWLSAGAARTERAFRTYMAAMGADDDDDDDDDEETASATGGPVRGMPASPGRHEGTARVVLSPTELGRVRKGDVLVVEFTTPAFNVVLPLVGAIVSDRGGLLSHTAIVAREQGIPAVVAASDATTRIPDGAHVRVDGTAGEVTVLA